MLYGAGVRFVCRTCSKLPYASQNETLQDRMMRKSRKIRRKLGASESLFEAIWQRPKGMHCLTFERLREEAWEAESICWSETMRHLSDMRDQLR